MYRVSKNNHSFDSMDAYINAFGQQGHVHNVVYIIKAHNSCTQTTYVQNILLMTILSSRK